MTDSLIDTPISLAQCVRCQAYVYLAMSSGVRSAANPAPADRAAYIQALTEGRRIFRLLEQAGRPWKLATVRPADLKPSFNTEGAQTGTQKLLAEHGCGAHALDATKFQPVDQPAPATTCDTWKAAGWTPPPGKCQRETNPSVKSCGTCEAPPFDEAPRERPTTAVQALGAPLPPPTPRRRSERPPHPGKGQSSDLGPVRCHICRRLIDSDTPHVGIHHGRWVWAVHDGECP